MLLALAGLLLLPAQAAEEDARLRQALPQDAGEVLEEVPLTGGAASGFRALKEAGERALRTALRDSMRSVFRILAVCLLLSLTESFAQGAGTPLPGRAGELAGSTAVLLLALGEHGTLLSQCRESITALRRFTRVFTGVFTAASAAAGRPASAVAAGSGAMVCCDALFGLCLSLALPAVTACLLVTYAGAVSGSGTLRQGGKLCKWALTRGMQLFLTGYFAYLSLTGLVTGTADAAAVRTAQSLSGALPVVGSIIAGASETILTASAALRAGVGCFGCLAAAAICLTPLVRGVCHLLAFRLLSALAASFAREGVKTVLEGLDGAYGMLTGILAACCAAQFITVAVALTVTGT